MLWTHSFRPLAERNDVERTKREYTRAVNGSRRGLVPSRSALGATVVGGFVALRAINGYGDSQPWSSQGDLLATVLSFIKCEKYPPSLHRAMTLGPALLV